MRLSLFLAAFALAAVPLLADAREGKSHKKKKVPQFKGKPDVHEHLIPAEVRDIQFLGEHGSFPTMFVLTKNRLLLRSTDEGRTWHPQNAFLDGSETVQPYGRGTGVYSIHPSPVNPNRLVVVGVGKRHWVTKDGGKSYSVLNTTADIREIQFHPTDEDSFLFSEKLPRCYDDSFEGPACTLQLFSSSDFGKTEPLLVARDVVQFGWGLPSDPAGTVFMTGYRGVMAPTLGMKFDIWDPKVSFYKGDSAGKGVEEVVPHGNSFSLNGDFIFVAVVVPVGNRNVVQLRVSSNGGRSWDEVRVPTELDQFGYSIVDASHGTAFLHVNHGDYKSAYGNLYVSDATGANYTVSLRNHARSPDGQTDFARVESIEGVYLANQVSNARDLDGPDADAPELRSFITFDKGSEWHPVVAPKDGRDGHPIECDSNAEVDGKCRLHLNGITNRNGFGPFYSPKSAAGIVVATGNVGAHLAANSDEVFTWISRDAGRTWAEAARGSYIYDIGDHGALLVMASNRLATNHVLYSVDEGRSWHSHMFRDEPVFVTNIVNNPGSTSLSFLLYGHTSEQHGILVHLDFAGLGLRKCEGADAAGQMEESDYEKWTPGHYDGDKCLMGRQVSYVRRKADRACFNGEKFERGTFVSACECKEADYECDYGYERAGDKPGQPCAVANPFLVHGARPKECPKGESYEISSGYRLVGGTTCKGGVDKRPRVYPCSGFVLGAVSHHGFRILVLFMMLFAILASVTAYSRVEKFRATVDAILARLPGGSAVSRGIAYGYDKLGTGGPGGGNGDTLFDDDEFDLDLGVIDDDMDNVLASAPDPTAAPIATGAGVRDTAADVVPAIDGPSAVANLEEGGGDDGGDGDDGDFNPRA